MKQDRGRRHDPEILADDLVELLLMNESAMLDRAHALFDAEIDPRSTMGVGRDIRIRTRGLFDCSRNLGTRIGTGMQRLARTTGATGSEQLDEVGTLPKVLPRELDDFRRAVRRPQPDAMAMRGRQRDARREHARPGNDAVGDRFLEIDIDIVFLSHDTGRGDAGPHVLQEVGETAQHVDARGQPFLRRLIALARHQRQMRMRIDDAGHHPGTAEIDDLDIGRQRGQAFERLHLDEASILDQHADIVPRRRAGAVEQEFALHKFQHVDLISNWSRHLPH
jgi:hypothetical protein